MNIQIKVLREEDFDDFFQILNAMSLWADMGEMNLEDKKRLHSHYFVDKPKYECRLAYADGKAVGFVSFFDTYATLEARSALYIEDIYVLDKSQFSGIGKALINECLKIARERNHIRVDLLSFGEGPRKFYEKMGAVWKDHNFHYRFSEDLIKSGIK